MAWRGYCGITERDDERIQNTGNLPYGCFRHFFEKNGQHIKLLSEKLAHFPVEPCFSSKLRAITRHFMHIQD